MSTTSNPATEGLALLDRLLALSREDREALGHLLLDSTLEGFDGNHATTQALWKEELRRRIDRVVRGGEETYPADEVIAEMRRAVARAHVP